jgi:hypothetical protein
VRFAVAGVALTLLAACTQPESSAAPATTSAPGSSAPGSSAPAPITSTAPADATTGATALALLAGVPVKGRAPRTGYDRDRFGPAWTDNTDDPLGHNGCDTRNDILRRDLVDLTLKPGSHGCSVLSGTLVDPYTGNRIAFQRGVATSARVQIDHVVALSDAWQTGAQYWPEQRRVELANDPLELLAVDGPTNEAKGDGDAATWLPPNKSFRCRYVARQVAVKTKYHLYVTTAERDAISGVLAGCAGEPLPTDRTLPAPK